MPRGRVIVKDRNNFEVRGEGRIDSYVSIKMNKE